MSSRQEQKERRRQEREERERAAAKAAKRKQLVQITGGVAVAAAVVIGIVLAASGGGGGGGETGDRLDGAAPAAITPPVQRQTNLAAAVKAAGCAFREYDDDGSTHVDDELTATDFKTNPPTSGNHNPVPSEDGYYPPGGEPALTNTVHALEHSRIIIQYNRSLPLRRQRLLRGLFNEPTAGGPERYHMLMFRNQSGMKYAVAATAWTRAVVCNQMNDRTFDAIRAFRDKFVDQGPEQVP